MVIKSVEEISVGFKDRIRVWEDGSSLERKWCYWKGYLLFYRGFFVLYVI